MSKGSIVGDGATLWGDCAHIRWVATKEDDSAFTNDEVLDLAALLAETLSSRGFVAGGGILPESDDEEVLQLRDKLAALGAAKGSDDA